MLPATLAHRVLHRAGLVTKLSGLLKVSRAQAGLQRRSNEALAVACGMLQTVRQQHAAGHCTPYPTMRAPSNCPQHARPKMSPPVLCGCR